jgi:hypothetical protein
MKRLIIGVVLAVAACGGSSGNGGNNGGTAGSVGGNALTIKDAIYATDPATLALVLLISDRTGLCDLWTSTTAPTGASTLLAVGLFVVDGSGTEQPLVTGDYQQLTTFSPPAGKWFLGSFATANGCTAGNMSTSTAGTITVSQLGGNTTGSHTTGHIAPKFGADSLNGDFDATYCAGLASAETKPSACP